MHSAHIVARVKKCGLGPSLIFRPARSSVLSVHIVAWIWWFQSPRSGISWEMWVWPWS